MPSQAMKTLVTDIKDGKEVRLIAQGIRPPATRIEPEVGVITADNGEELVNNLFPNSPLPPTPEVRYFIPLNLLRDDRQDNNNSTGNKIRNQNRENQDNKGNYGIAQFIGAPAAIIIDRPKLDQKITKPMSMNNQQKDKTGGKEQNDEYENEWMRNTKQSTSLHLITDKGFSDANTSMNTHIIAAVLKYDYVGIASRSGILGLSSSSSAAKECSFFNLNILGENNMIGHSLPIIFKANMRSNVTITSFSISDIAINLYDNGNQEKVKEKEKEKDRIATDQLSSNTLGKRKSFTISDTKASTATFHPIIENNKDNQKDREKENNNNTNNNANNKDHNNSDKNNNISTGHNALLLLGDSSGTVHFCVVSKSSISQSGSFHAHSGPIVSVITTGIYADLIDLIYLFYLFYYYFIYAIYAIYFYLFYFICVIEKMYSMISFICCWSA